MEIRRLKKKILQEETRRRKSEKPRRKRIIISLVFFVLLLSAGVLLYQRNLDDILERQFSRAEALQEQGEYSRAYDKFRRLYERHPSFHRSPEALFLAGEILHFHLKRDNEALLAYLLVERDYPEKQVSYRAQYRVAEIYKYRLEDYSQALPAFQKLLDSGFGEDAKIQYEIADTYFRQNNLEQARIEFESLVKNYPQSPLLAETLFRIGATFALEGKLQDAEFIFKKLIEEHPESPFATEAQLGLASVLERREDLCTALEILQKLRENNVKPGILDRKIDQVKERMQKKKKAI